MSYVIMVVDNSESVRELIAFSLENAGYHVVKASDGLDAVNKIKSRIDLDMLITDLNMPNMNGIELSRQVRVNPQHRFIPIIVITTESDELKKKEAKTAGASGWLKKPFKPQQILAVVKKVLG